MATVPGFTRLCTLGTGATATVSLASDCDSGRLYAIKSAELSRASPLQHEHRILSSISSPHIISCHGSYASNSHFHLLLEFAAGGSLFDRIKSHTQGCLDECDVRSYARDILLGLSYLHSNSIFHGDIKSQNILIGSDGRAKIADFGAAMQTSETHDEKPGPLLGTPSFMAPEVARGEERGLEADIWALGCTIIEMATGKAPWHGIIKDQDVVSAVYQIGFCSDSIPEMPDCISEEGKHFLMNCLKRDPRERWSAEKLLNHPFVRLSEAGMKRDGSSVSTFSPQSALDFGLVFHDSETEDEAEEEETGLDATERILELAGSGFESRLFDWDLNEDGWVEVRGSSNGGENVAGENGECEDRDDQAQFLDYGDDTDLVFENLHLDVNLVDVLDRIHEEGDCLLQSSYEFDACKANSINKAVNSSFDQTLNPSLFLVVYILTF
ncbi:mitogen-activated protein kinase kinase kinase 3 [Rhynchospora pubera]|uniref:Mitogen-activated protein kinase kinase kinase 3 n=1 Tax=Rhynchospora pubera TaxID=906938 RepID=A0AAV8D1K3_9POAL|nr:mitogen-activated protein kinase kinase kinase 3 [Rhynchospora pubera]